MDTTQRTDDVVRALGDLPSRLVNTLAALHPQVDPTVLATMVTAGNAVVDEFLHGFSGTHDMATLLLADQPVPVPVPDSYSLCALYYQEPRSPEQMAERIKAWGGDGTYTQLGTNGGVVLLSADDIPSAWARAEELQELIGECWLAATWRPRGQLAEGRRQASKVVALVAAGRPTGTYCVMHVLTEYAAAENPDVCEGLTETIRPLTAHPVLMDTLAALIAADGNRALAASRLHIHRSTLDYRLRRIGQLTGQSPTTTHGRHTLATARALYLINDRVS
ncbi:PucR family transcriptional regulator [Kutzneria sp. CA-103260]|uniref:PucR family transcriptional regulator n=1 Tax=Kutzneria sp. CA-103260 TaxID=2802641 RepID=UPI001BAC67E9|nr:helix-turn-helix domain-containing protein [Kutzneria sp. CA-103260]QUQ63733.1 hypothetical protein JJ691_14460 [Kutzneria sp. CA-103260]